jgi:hypothetical protein
MKVQGNSLFVLLVLATLVMWGVSARAAQALSRTEIQRIVIDESELDGTVPPSLALAVARVESNFDDAALSHAGARGVMQIMPRTARGEYGVDAADLWDARTNVRLGIRYLHQLYDQYGRRWDLALSHYNGGGLSRNRFGMYKPHSYTRGYVKNVLSASREYERTRLVARVSSSRAIAKPKPAESDWVFDEPGVDRSWRDYLDIANRWMSGAPEPTPQASIDRIEPSELQREMRRSRARFCDYLVDRGESNDPGRCDEIRRSRPPGRFL